MQKWKEIYKIDHRLKVPLYHQIVQNITELVESGHLSPGEILPPEWNLTDLYGVSRPTIRQAFDKLERDGIVNRRHGVGTFVANPSTRLMPSRKSFTEKILQIGKVPSSKLLSFAVIPAPVEVARNLLLEPDAPVIEISRIRYADEEPIMHETAYLPAERFSDLNETRLGGQSLYRFLKDVYQINIETVEQSLQPIILTSRQASLLDTEPNTPAMLTRVTAYIQNNIPIEYSISITRGDKSRFYFNFRE